MMGPYGNLGSQSLLSFSFIQTLVQQGEVFSCDFWTTQLHPIKCWHGIVVILLFKPAITYHSSGISVHQRTITDYPLFYFFPHLLFQIRLHIVIGEGPSGQSLQSSY